MTTRKFIYETIDSERDYQESKWNANTTRSGGKHSNVEFLVFIRDYVEEALHKASREADPAANEFCKHNLRKVAALAVAAMEQNGCRERQS